MLDYLSDYPGPSREEAIENIKICIKKMPQFKQVSDVYIEKEISKNYDIVTRNGTFCCSAAGWLTFESHEILKKTKHSINILNYKKYRFKAIIKTLALLNKWLLDTNKKRYAPGGVGMLDALNEFERYKNIYN
jgi:hypothetical protein|tara:strand:+ start:499 stop:897 length:399 start_codon:yes stop_codon:yes gene_type:complete